MTRPPTRTIVVILGIILIAVLAYAVPSCMEKRRSAATQARVEVGQKGAALDSAKDAIDVTARSGERETASEAMTADNARDIRGAEGARERVQAPVDAAGRRALCRRKAYENDPKCAVFKGATK